MGIPGEKQVWFTKLFFLQLAQSQVSANANNNKKAQTS